MNLATKLLTLRKQKGLTQMDLAEQLNVSRQAISRWEVGVAIPSTDNLKVLAELYGVQVDFLLNDGLEEAPNSNEAAGNEPIAHKRRMYKVVTVCVLVTILITILILVGIVRDHSEKQNTPLRDMDSRVEDDYTICTFDIE